ncbi:MAG TPA: AAA family ATPase [Anaerolineae bacterium]
MKSPNANSASWMHAYTRRDWLYAPGKPFYVLRFTFYVLRLLLVSLILVVLAHSAPPASAQSQSANYWRHPASRRLTHIVAADVNHDGVDEFLVVAENGKVDLVSSDGRAKWSYAAGEQLFAVGTANVDGPSQPDREVILAARNRLILLTAEGRELWQTPIKPVATPLTLLTGGSLETESEWLAQYDAIPVEVAALDADDDDSEELVVLLESGQVQLYDGDGALLWRHTRDTVPSVSTQPRMATGDLDGDGTTEIVLGFFNPQRRFSQLDLIAGNGEARWDQVQAVSGRLTALTLVPFGDHGELHIAVGSSLGRINFYDGERRSTFFRTLNKPITAMTVAYLPEGPILVAGTEVGTVVAYNAEGRRVLTRNLATGANRTIVALSAASFIPAESQSMLAVVLGPTEGGAERSDIILLGGNGRSLDSFEAMDTTGLTRLLDINGDQNSELLLARFATVELLGLGTGASETAREWDYNLHAAPSSILIVDFDQDGNDELLIGAQNGRLHRLDNNSPTWIVAPGGAVTHLALLASSSLVEPPAIVVVRNNVVTGPDEEKQYESWVELRQANGEQIWEESLPVKITSLLVGEINNRGEPEIVLGTNQGDVIVYNTTGTRLWEQKVEEEVSLGARENPDGNISQRDLSVRYLLMSESKATEEPELLAATANRVYKVNNLFSPVAIASYPDTEIRGLYPLQQPGNELATTLLVLLADGTIQGLNWRGIQLPKWQDFTLEGTPISSLRSNEMIEEAFEESTVESFLVATNASRLLRINVEENRPQILWTLTGVDEITSLYWGDLDGDALPDIAIGDQEGKVRLYTHQPRFLDELNLTSSVFALTTLRRETEQRSDLLAITENGEVQLFRAQENRPPLLTNPTTAVSQGQYSFSVSVIDVEGDRVTVSLEIQDPANPSRWIKLEEQQTTGGLLFWPVVDLPDSTTGVHYRFRYSDGSYESYVTPPPGPAPIPASPFADASPFIFILAGAVGVITLALLIRQMQLPAARARRFYRRLKQRPELTLVLLEAKYTYTGGSPDFLLYLASQARQRGDRLIAGLADGLYLLNDRPQVGLPIIIGALDDAHKLEPSWQAIDRWQMIYKMGQALLEAPSITEISLLRPQLVQLLSILEETGQWSPILESLLPIMTNLRDSERVELAEDRLVYLNEAAHHLHALQAELPEFSIRMEKTLVAAIIRRWSGLVNAESEELRGRAELVIALKTKRIVPNEETEIVLEIGNNGRAAAENIVAVLDDEPSYRVKSLPQSVSLLPPGRTRQVSFAVEPQVHDRFRLALTVTYDDRNQRDKVVAFGDMIHLLLPVRDFKPIANPYLPGTPLRRNSTVFYGRQQLFSFIAENAGNWTQRNVLILVGQRRTGKTSALLRLEQHLPDHIMPVYIDCQSLGVTPGMPALFHDLAWHIADALATHDININVPAPSAWQEDPTGRFQRHFLPTVKSLLPADTTLLLVFDEFETFENLVEDGFLPSTFFSFMRHLMQHSQGLSFVFVGTRRLEEMSADYWSVLFNIALYEKIGYLSAESATQLICEPVAPNLVYDDLAIDKILRVTAGHPYFLQLVCYTLVKRANTTRTGYVTISDVNAALDEMLRLGEVHFAYLWQRSTYAERALLTAVAHMMDRNNAFHPEDLIAYLEPHGIHLNPVEVTAALNSLVEREIMHEVKQGVITLYELKIGLVGLWVEQHKSLSKLYASSNGEQRLLVKQGV